MKKIIPVALLLLLLSGCDQKGKEEAAPTLNQGYVNFSAILVLDDLITNGINSDFVSLSPVPIIDPDNAVTAESVLEDFRNNFVDAQDKYPVKLSEGLSITWDLDHNADAQYGLSFHKEDRDKKMVFAGKLSLRFDPEYYSSTYYPTFSKGSSATVICREFMGATERKSDYLLWVEVSLDKCMTATDYYASVKNLLKTQQAPLKERLTSIYAGNEAVSEEMAKTLAAFYRTGNAFAPDSVCLTGEHEECLANLKTEIVRKHEETQNLDTDGMKIRTDGKAPQKKPETQASPPDSAPAAEQPKAQVEVNIEKPGNAATTPPDGKPAAETGAGAATEGAAKAPAEKPVDKPAPLPSELGKPAS